MSSGSVNLQDSYLNQARKESVAVEVTLVSGITFQGVVRGFDSFTVVFQVGEKQHLVYKHAIAQVVSERFSRYPVSVEQDQPRGSAPQQQAGRRREGEGGGQRREGEGGGRRREGEGGGQQPRPPRPLRPPRESGPTVRPEPFNGIDLSKVRLESVSTATVATQARHTAPPTPAPGHAPQTEPPTTAPSHVPQTEPPTTTPSHVPQTEPTPAPSPASAPERLADVPIVAVPKAEALPPATEHQAPMPETAAPDPAQN